MKSIYLSILVFWAISLEAQYSYLIQLDAPSSKEKIQNIFSSEVDQTPSLIKKIHLFGQTKHFAYLESSKPLKPNILTRGKSIGQVFPFDNDPVDLRSLTPNDPLFSDQWCLDLIQAPDVWEFTQGGNTLEGKEIVVAILDSGFDMSHEDLLDNRFANPIEINGEIGVDDDNNGYVDDFYGYDFVANDPVIFPDSHGNGVAGIIGASGDNSMGISGVNWKVKILPLRVSNKLNIMEAYSYILDMRTKFNASNGEEGAFIVVSNASLGYNNDPCLDFPWDEMFDDLGQAGVLSVGATSNSYVNVDEEGDWPTSCSSDYLITVTTTDKFDQFNNYAGYGSQSIDLGAPGGVYQDATPSTNLDDEYTESFCCTSAAAPLVAGSIALLYSQPSSSIDSMAQVNPADLAQMMKQAIMEGTDPMTDLQNISVSGGRLNIYGALQKLHELQQDFPLNGDESYIDNFNILRIFPNPVRQDQEIKIIFAKENFQPFDYQIYDSAGKLLLRGDSDVTPLSQNELSINVGYLPTGLYTISLTSSNGRTNAKFTVL